LIPENKDIRDILEKILKDSSLRRDFAKIIIECINEDSSLQDLLYRTVSRRMASEFRRMGVR
jgi:hypothetical protein